MVNMRGFSFRSLAFMLFIVFLVWSASFDTCIARRGKHWRQSRSNPASLAKKKGKSHGNSHHQHHTGVPKPKAPPHKAPALPPPAPKEKAPKPSPPQKGSTTLNPHPSPPAMTRELFAPHSTVLAAMSWFTWRYGATQAFQAAWAAACKVAASTLIVPAEYVFLVGPISFSGPYCQANIVFQLDGTIIAPSNANAWGRGLLQWLEFTKLVGITIQGKGTIDGSGSVWWQDYPFEDPIDSESELIIPLNNTVQQHPPMPIRNELNGKMPSIKPTALRFYGSFNVTVTGITIQNSPQCHLKFDNCVGVVVHDMRVSSPGDSPNTDGIHLILFVNFSYRHSTATVYLTHGNQQPPRFLSILAFVASLQFFLSLSVIRTSASILFLLLCFLNKIC